MDDPRQPFPSIDLPTHSDRRRRLRIAISLAGLAFTCLAFGIWLLTQPMRLAQPSGDPGWASPSRLESSVRMLSESLGPRDWHHPERLDAAASHLRNRLEACGGRVSEQVFQVRGRTYRNVVAGFGPAQGPVIVVGAHYDTFEALPGADDNASGVAGLLELAQRLGEQPPPGPVELVAYSLEEPPFFHTQAMGSVHHAQALKDSGRTVKAMLVLEMIGFFSDAPDSQDFPLPFASLCYPSRGNFIAIVRDLGSISLTRQVKRTMAEASPLPVRSMNAPRFVPGIDFSDHHPYWDRGFPAVMITDSAFNRNRAYHTAKDTPERLDYRRMAQVIEGVDATVRQLARESSSIITK